MKRISAIPVVISFGLAACDTMNRPVTGGSFDPLRAPGSDEMGVVANNAVFPAGQFVRAVMDNTAFFKARPNGDVDADKLLARGTSMKVISSSDSYVKVELDSGEIGWVPTVMLEDPNAAAPQGTTFGAPNPGEVQVYPPTGNYGAALPSVTPAELPPEGAIPTVIDPESLGNPAPVPPATVPSEAFPAPAPLPPNGEKVE